jgi:SAM-dependent methyltransferase
LYWNRDIKSQMTEQPSSWDRVWTESSIAGGLSLDAPVLENHIDRGKIDFILPCLPQRGRAVEVGCGSARLLGRLGIARPYELTALDTSLEALRSARETSRLAGVPIRLVCGDTLRLPFADGTFDVILSGGLLEHFREPEKVLQEMVRVLRPGGIFYADVVPRKFSLYRVREAFRMLRSEWLLPGVFETTYGGEHYRRRLTELGCEEVVVEYRGVYPPYWTMKFLRLASSLDDTFVARLLGWHFMIRARKAG